MSHFLVAVITRKNPDESDIIEQMLKPYSENDSVAPYIVETKEQFLKKEREELEAYKNGRYAEYLKDPDGYASKCVNNPGHLRYIKNFMDVYNKTDEELLEERAEEYPHYNDEELDYGATFLDKYGNKWTTYSPYSKWDWYTIGGRWDCSIPLVSEVGKELKNGANTAQIKDIYFGVDVDIESITKKQEIIDAYDKLMTEGDGWHRIEYLKKRYPSIEDYIKDKEFWSTFAVIDQNGVWHEKGDMGWFGMSTDTPEDAINWVNNFYENYFKDINPEWYVTIVDCHI